MKNWFDIIPSHGDIRKGHFDEAVFAADLGDVAAGTAPLRPNAESVPGSAEAARPEQVLIQVEDLEWIGKLSSLQVSNAP